MQTVGIKRTVDKLGRLVIPKEMRDAIGVNSGQDAEIIMVDDKIIVQKYQDRCCICGGVSDNYIHMSDKLVCLACVRRIRKLVDDD